MNGTLSTDVGDQSQQDDIIATLKNLQQKNVELSAILAYQRQENDTYKIRFKALSHKLIKVNESLEKNVQVLFTLFEESKNALHAGKSALQSGTISETAPIAKPGPSTTVLSRKKLHIDRIQLKELETSLEDVGPTVNSALTSLTENGKKQTIEINPQSENSSVPASGQSVNISESSIAAKELLVKVSRLPDNIVQEHLNRSKQKSPSPECLLNLTTSFSSRDPECTSTPLQVEAMKQIGLHPTPLFFRSSHFVNMRRKKSEEDTQNNKRVESSPVNLRKESPIQKKKVRSRARPQKSTTPEATVRSPKSRKARPETLEEPNLRKKMRRQ